MLESSLTELCKTLEHYETPEWAVRAILEKELIAGRVVDPCCGTGVISEIAKQAGHKVLSFDIHDWGYPGTVVRDWSKYTSHHHNDTCFMNPPFSLAEDFVEHAFGLQFRKTICFQRFSWFESNDRREFWDKYPPSRIWLCGSRATCWRHDIPINENGKRYNPETGKELAGTTTAHAWFVFDRDAPPGTLIGRIYKGSHDAA